MKRHETNFTEYLGIEEQNLLTNLINFKDEISLFRTLDRIYQEPLKGLELPPDKDYFPWFYHFVHFYLYFSFSCLMRAHIYECLSSVRKAIDASFCAYKIILDPNLFPKYKERDTIFQFIKSTIKKERKENPSKDQLLDLLIDIHEFCSQYASHADVSTFEHRIEIKEIPGTNKDMMFQHFFQFPRDDEDYRFYFYYTMQSFFLMFLVFKPFLDENLSNIDKEWVSAVAQFDKHLKQLGKKYLSEIKNDKV